MRVSVERASGRTQVQQGLVVSDGAVLTVLDSMEEIASLSVRVSGRGVFLRLSASTSSPARRGLASVLRASPWHLGSQCCS